MARIILDAIHVDTCLSDYWGGHHEAHVSIYVRPGMTLADIKGELHSELNQGAVCGSNPLTRDDSGDEGDRWYRAAHAAVNRIKPRVKGQRRFFTDVELDEDGDSACMAYFLFVDAQG